MRSPQPVSSDTISCVLQAALEVFCNAGYRTSIDAVATRAGVARQTIYNNFGNKQNLFSKALEHGMASFWAEIEPCGDTIEQKLLSFARNFRQHSLCPEMAQLHCKLVGEAPRFPEQARDFFEKTHMAIRRQLAELLHSAMSQGELLRDDPLQAANFFIDSLNGFDQERLQFTNELPDPSQEEERIQKHVARFLRAYAPETLQ